jgi:hypothetical protein
MYYILLRYLVDDLGNEKPFYGSFGQKISNKDISDSIDSATTTTFGNDFHEELNSGSYCD